MKKVTDKIWQSNDVVQRYLEGIRGAVPFAEQQIEVMMRLIDCRDTVEDVLDLGCGNGILGAAILERYPKVKMTLTDFSAPMLDAARESFDQADTIDFVLADYSSPEWTDKVCAGKTFDVIVSGYSIHHQSDQRKQEVYKEIFECLNPGGIFINMEHIEPGSKLCADQFLNHMVDNLFAQEKDTGRTREEIMDAMINNEDSQANILAPVDRQCDWLTKIGYTEVDCFFRAWELAVFGGIKPPKT
jgi:ubiquinone/menaquinone biosynthesis C-methylase UbiE